VARRDEDHDDLADGKPPGEESGAKASLVFAWFSRLTETSSPAVRFAPDDASRTVDYASALIVRGRTIAH
jgi:hypothetical protein